MERTVIWLVFTGDIDAAEAHETQEGAETAFCSLMSDFMAGEYVRTRAEGGLSRIIYWRNKTRELGECVTSNDLYRFYLDLALEQDGWLYSGVIPIWLWKKDEV